MKSAIISPCGNFRYRLDRTSLEPLPEGDGSHPLRGKVVAFFGVNPSTADAAINDPTVRKWIGFCRRWGVSSFIVGNVFSYRSTKVKELGKTPFPQGPAHFEHLMKIIEDADVLVPCWGSVGKVPKNIRWHFDSLMGTLIRSGKPVLHFGIAKCGSPLHPLMLAYKTPITPWSHQ